MLQSFHKDEPLSTAELLLAGGAAGFGAWIPAYPQDVIKSRYQNDTRYVQPLGDWEECIDDFTIDTHPPDMLSDL